MVASLMKVGQQVAYRCLARTKEQQHSFNCPFQLSRLPVPDDFPRLVKEGLRRLKKEKATLLRIAPVSV
eukprot:1105589-Amphidinium_carterae.2